MNQTFLYLYNFCLSVCHVSIFQPSKQYWTINSRKNSSRAGREAEDMEFPGVYWRKSLWKFQGGQLKKKWGISRGDPDKIMRNFHWFWFLALEFSRSVIISHNFVDFRGMKLCFLWRISKGKVTNLKIPGFFSKKYVPKTSPVWIFSAGIAHFQFQG